MSLRKQANEKNDRTRPRWRRWLRRIVVLGVGMLLILRVSQSIWLPSAVAWIGKTQGLEVRYADLDLALLQGEIQLEGLEVRPMDSDGDASSPGEALDPWFSLGHLRVDADISALFGARLRVHRIDIENVDLRVHRSEDGAVNWLTWLEARSAEGEEDPPEEEEDGSPAEPAPLVFDLPLEVGVVHARHLRVHVYDETQSPAFTTRLELEARVDSVGVQGEATRIDLRAHASDVFGEARLAADLLADGRELDAHLDMRLRGYQPTALEGYWREMSSILGLELTAIAQRFEAEGQLQLRVAGREGDALASTLELDVGPLQARVDDLEAVALDQLELRIPSFHGSSFEEVSVQIDGARARGLRDAEGALHLLGMRIDAGASPGSPSGPATSVDATDSAVADEAGEGSPTDPRAGGGEDAPPTVFTLKEFLVTNASLSLQDEAADPPVELQASLDRLQLGDLRLDPEDEGREATLELEASFPGVFGTSRVSGTLVPTGSQRRAALSVEVEGIQPDKLQSHLASLGLRSRYEQGSFRAELGAEIHTDDQGVLEASARLEGISLRESPGSPPTAGVQSLGIDDVTYRPEERSLHVGLVELAGLQGKMGRDVAGSWRALGFETTGAHLAPDSGGTGRPAPADGVSTADGTAPGQAGAESDGDPAGTPPTGSTDAKKSGLHVEVARIAWIDTDLQVLDEFVSPPVDLNLDELALEWTGLGFGGPEDAPERRSQLTLEFAAEGLTDRANLRGSFTHDSEFSHLLVELGIEASGLSLAGIEPYLRDANIASELEGAAVRGRIETELHRGDSTLRGRVGFEDFHYGLPGEDPFLALDAARIEGLALEDSGLEVDSIHILRPRTRANRDVEGQLHLLGIALLSPAEGEASSGSGEALRGPESRPSDPPPTRDEGAGDFAIQIHRVLLEQAQIQWTDLAVAPAVETRLDARLQLDGLSTAAGARESEFDARMSIDGSIDELAFRGSLGANPDDLRLSAQLEGRGIRPGTLTGYLPKDQEVLLEDGRLTLSMEGAWGLHGDGGRTGRLELSGLDYREAESEYPYLELESMRAILPRIDAEAGMYHIGDLSLNGLRTSARRTAPDRVEAMGFAWTSGAPLEVAEGSRDPESGSPPSPSSENSENSDSGAGTAGSDLVADHEGQADANAPAVRIAGSASGIDDAASSRPDELPTVLLDHLDLGIAQVHFEDQTHGDATPLDFALHLVSEAPQTLLAPDAESLEPIQFLIEGACDPIARELLGTLTVTPYAPVPEFDLILAAQGLRGEGLTEVLPDLAEQLDGSQLADGSLTMHLNAIAEWRRRSPVDFDLSAGFGGELLLQDVLLIPQPGAEPVLGLESLRIEAKQIRPETGAVHLTSVEITKPIARIRQDARGLHALGLTLLTPPEAAEGSGVETEGPPEGIDGDPSGPVTGEGASPAVADGQDPEAPVEQAPPLERAPGPEFRVDEFLVQGLDVRFLDERSDPPLDLPLEDLEVELQRFTTLAFHEPRPVRFRALLTGGNVALPQRDPANSLLLSVAEAAAAKMRGDQDAFELEQRSAFEEMSLSGRLQLYPHIVGWAKAQVVNLELSGFRGPAADAGVDIGDGLLDSQVDLRFGGEAGVTIDTTTTLRHLSLSEPPGGPISTYLKLPAPLDTVLFMLRDREGQQNLPFTLHVEESGVSGGRIAKEAVKTLGLVIGEAVAASPLRFATSLTDLVGLTGDESIQAEGQAVVVGFAPGASTPTDAAWANIEAILDPLSRDDELIVTLEHRFSEEDLERAAAIANPSVEDCLDLSERLRDEKARIALDRKVLAAEVRALHRIGAREQAASVTEKLRAMDQRSLEVEDALDRVLDRLAPGEARRTDRRTRAAALALGDLRLATLSRRLRNSGLRNADLRIDVRRARFGSRVEQAEDARVEPAPERPLIPTDPGLSPEGSMDQSELGEALESDEFELSGGEIVLRLRRKRLQ